MNAMDPRADPTMEQRFLSVLVTLGEGEVVSYGDVADVAGHPGRSRAVGRLLSTTTVDVPWWRVVRSDGTIATDPAASQAELLRAEGVTVERGRVVAAPHGRFSEETGTDDVSRSTLTANPPQNETPGRPLGSTPGRRSPHDP